ncbi:hypothetical protein Ddc_07274 [Ditylenchus destructor]|nr:hypothetical protein Ddc_07274 [Ditylenchus destructor]
MATFRLNCLLSSHPSFRMPHNSRQCDYNHGINGGLCVTQAYDPTVFVGLCKNFLRSNGNISTQLPFLCFHQISKKMVRLAEDFRYRILILAFWIIAAITVYNYIPVGEMSEDSRGICFGGFVLGLVAWIISVLKCFVVCETTTEQVLFSIVQAISKAMLPFAIGFVLFNYLSCRELYVIILPAFLALGDTNFDLLSI